MSIFGRKPLSDLVVPFKFGICILKNPYVQSFMLSAESEHLDHFLLHIRSTIMIYLPALIFFGIKSNITFFNVGLVNY